MGLIKGGFSRIFQTFLYFLAFLCSAIILGIYSYFLSVLADHHQKGTPSLIKKKWKAVEGISGIAVVYTLFAIVLTCCLGGISFFAFFAIVIDVLLVGGMIAIAILLKEGAKSCSNHSATTPLSILEDAGHFDHHVTYNVKYKTACGLNKAAFAVAIIGAFFFLLCAAFQVQLARSHKKEKRFGPGPDNNYTSGKKTSLFARRKNKNATRDAEMGTAAPAAGGLTAGQPDMRPSHETGYTGSTVAAPNAGTYDKVENGYGHGYHTQPTGTATNY